MYSNIRNVQILVSLLKQFNIKNVVLSPGGSDIPIIHTLECDDFFNCYSVVDERNATYFALGLAQEMNLPVACVCTSGTAICNYLPGITEAYYQNVPIIAITADKNPYYQGQLETQKIDQMNTFTNVVKKSVDLPVIKNDDDEWLCNRLLNDVLLEMNHHGDGPIHINIPIVGDTSSYTKSELKPERVINRIELPVNKETWMNYVDKLKSKEKIMIIVGQNVRFSKKDINNFSLFFKRFNCFFAVEHLSNLSCDGVINTYPITEMGGLNDKLLPDLIISIGNNLASYNLKPFLRKKYKQTENWYIDPSGKLRDSYKSLTNIFECSVSDFFDNIISNSFDDMINNLEYYQLWRELSNSVKIPELQFSNMYVAKKMAEIIPKNSLLHLAILNSTRTMQFFELKENVKTYSNVGALGIDGCLATFAGQAAATKEKAYLIIGDLSFFYGMNGAALRSISNNVRIILLNNSGGSEFHFFMGKDKIPTINDFISAEHNHTAEGWIKSLDYEYYSVSTKEDFDNISIIMEKDSKKPIFIEVFTNMEEDAKQINKIYNENKYNFSMNEGGINGLKGAINSKLSVEQKQRIKKVINILKK